MMNKLKIILFILLYIPFTMQAQHPTIGVLPFQENFIHDLPSVRDLAMNKAGDEIYFTIQGFQGEFSTIVQSKFVNGKWEAISIAPFSGKHDDLEPFLSPNELRLYFASNRALENVVDIIPDYDIWFVERKTLRGAWSAPINIGSPINTLQDEFYPCVTLSGNIYFTSVGAGSKGKDDIFLCEWDNGKFNPPQSLDTTINSAGYEFNAYVSPDESFIIFTGYNRPGGQGSGDLYISKKLPNGNWEQAINMGPEINSKQMDYCPYVNLKNQELYFTSKRNSMGARAKEFQTLQQLLSELNSYSNGLSRLYKTPFLIK
jgi:WD40-like Beta Propeller Repeat